MGISKETIFVTGVWFYRVKLRSAFVKDLCLRTCCCFGQTDLCGAPTQFGTGGKGGRCEVVVGDIADGKKVDEIFEKYRPQSVVNFAAESHVDRSIDEPAPFLHTNVAGTFTLLEATRKYLSGTKGKQSEEFRFIHLSTDEVHGSLEPEDPPFCETSTFAPNSPYAASKAAADHLCRAYYRTYRVPTIVLRPSNNFGPYQFPEKLIPLAILRAIAGKKYRFMEMANKCATGFMLKIRHGLWRPRGTRGVWVRLIRSEQMQRRTTEPSLQRSVTYWIKFAHGRIRSRIET